MATKATIECSLNTTECILETIASILSEIQEQNNEYNWDPLTFGFTAIIGILAIIVAGLAATQGFLAAGPGRTKSGVYAIGPWSQLNHRKFDLAEMRFRTTSFTPILTLESLNLALLEDSCADQDPPKFRKGQDDYFPATWLALLTQLSPDNTKLWHDIKLTGADFIPSEFPAVPAYGSIRFIVTLAIVLSDGRGRLTFDRESGLPRVRDRRFNLVFRQHPLLGAIGFFEMYGRIPFGSSGQRDNVHGRLLQAHGNMRTSEFVQDIIWHCIASGEYLTFNNLEGKKSIRSFMFDVRQQCPHRNLKPNPACVNVLEVLGVANHYFFTSGPLYLLIEPIPSSDFLPYFFPHKRAGFRERLETLQLQSRHWSMKNSAARRCHPFYLSADDAHDRLQMINIAVSWARSNVKPDIYKLRVAERAYQLCLKYLEQSSTPKSEYDEESRNDQWELLHELKAIDLWLEQIKPHVLCRKLTLSVLGDAIRRMIDRCQQQPVIRAQSGLKVATGPSSLDGIMLPGLFDKLGHLMVGIDVLDRFNLSYSDMISPCGELNDDVSEGLMNIKILWETEELPLSYEVSGSEDGADADQEHKNRSWRFPFATLHPLDDVLIYRAVLLTLLYCLSKDSSDFIDEDAWDIIVPIV